MPVVLFFELKFGWRLDNQILSNFHNSLKLLMIGLSNGIKPNVVRTFDVKFLLPRSDSRWRSSALVRSLGRSLPSVARPPHLRLGRRRIYSKRFVGVGVDTGG